MWLAVVSALTGLGLGFGLGWYAGWHRAFWAGWDHAMKIARRVVSEPDMVDRLLDRS